MTVSLVEIAVGAPMSAWEIGPNTQFKMALFENPQFRINTMNPIVPKFDDYIIDRE